MSFKALLFFLLTLVTFAHAEEPKSKFWHGFMVVDTKQHKVALLDWDGNGELDPTQSTVVTGTLMPGKEATYTYMIPFPSFFTEVTEAFTFVTTTAQLNPQCSVTSFAMISKPPLVVTSNGVTGTLYKASLADESLIGSKGSDCARLLDIKPR